MINFLKKKKIKSMNMYVNRDTIDNIDTFPKKKKTKTINMLANYRKNSLFMD